MLESSKILCMEQVPREKYVSVMRNHCISCRTDGPSMLLAIQLPIAPLQKRNLMSSSSPHQRGRSPTPRTKATNAASSSSQCISSTTTASASSKTFLFCILFSFAITLGIMSILYPEELSLLLFHSDSRFSRLDSLSTGRNNSSSSSTVPSSFQSIPESIDPNAILHTLHLPPTCLTHPSSTTCPPTLLNSTHISSYTSDGVLALRGLFPPTTLQSLNASSHELLQHQLRTTGKTPGMRNGKQFYSTQMGVLFRGEEEIADGFRSVALESVLPRVAAELMGLTNRKEEEEEGEETDGGERVRMLRCVRLCDFVL